MGRVVGRLGPSLKLPAGRAGEAHSFLWGCSRTARPPPLRSATSVQKTFPRADCISYPKTDHPACHISCKTPQAYPFFLAPTQLRPPITCPTCASRHPPRALPAYLQQHWPRYKHAILSRHFISSMVDIKFYSGGGTPRQRPPPYLGQFFAKDHPTTPLPL